MRTKARSQMVETMTKLIFSSRVLLRDNGWFITTSLPDSGEIFAFAESSDEIDLVTRENICSSTDLNPFDFDLSFVFPEVSPKYYS